MIIKEKLSPILRGILCIVFGALAFIFLALFSSLGAYLVISGLSWLFQLLLVWFKG